jgi:short-subunit dehydrogenase
MKIFVITGASDGIGAEMARQLAAGHGAQAGLVLAARNQEKLEAVAAQCRALGAQCEVAPANVSEEAQCRALIDRSVQAFARIDVLINNAGVSAHALFADVKSQDLHWYENLMKINLWGSVWCTHAALPHLKASRGQIVAVSSVAGLIGVPGRTAYCASKFAMTGFFEALRAELKSSGVSVTVAYPGVVATAIRYRGYNAKGEVAGVSGLKEDKAMSVEECARLIIDGAHQRRREIVMSTKARLGRFAKLIVPGMVEQAAVAALKEDVRPH